MSFSQDIATFQNEISPIKLKSYGTDLKSMKWTQGYCQGLNV